MMIETQMATPSPVSWPRRAPEPPAVHQAHVLAVDDSLVDRKVIETLLRVSSCKVTAVDSGRRALQFLGLDDERSGGEEGVMGLKVDMIVTDYSMPGMTGYELLKRIKGSSAFREVPVVIMSSENINARIDRCLEEGAEDYIVKPVKLADVRRIKDYMTRDEISEVGKESRINKRKSREETDRTMPTTYPSSPSETQQGVSVVVVSSMSESASSPESQQLSNTSSVPSSLENQSSSPLTTQPPHSLSQSCLIHSKSS